MIEGVSSIFTFLSEASRFGNPVTANALFDSEEDMQKMGIDEVNAHTSLWSIRENDFYKYNGVEVVSSIELSFQDGSLIWYIQIDLRRDAINVRAYTKALYKEPPHELWVEDLYDQSMIDGRDYINIVSNAVDTSLESIKNALEGSKFLAIHAKAKSEYPESLYR